MSGRITPTVPKFVTHSTTARGTEINVPCFPVSNPFRFLAKSVAKHTHIRNNYILDDRRGEIINKLWGKQSEGRKARVKREETEFRSHFILG
jgi:hypothetical protein